MGQRCYMFLDVDGVFNSTAWFHALYERKKHAAKHPHDHLDPEAIARANRIVEETGAKVVISSTWRIGRTVEELQDLFALHGFKGDIVGKTPGGGGGLRGEKILDWLRDIGEQGASFIAIDDDSYDMDAVADRLVQTDNEVGLTDADADRAIAMLTGAA